MRKEWRDVTNRLQIPDAAQECFDLYYNRGVRWKRCNVKGWDAKKD